MATKKFVCKVCGYTCEGENPPAVCPQCKAPASEFEVVGEPKKGFLGGKNSNAYIIVYSFVMVVLVAALLSVTSQLLKGRQNENMLNEKKQQIVKALGDDPATTDYSAVVAEALLLDADGAPVAGKSEADVFKALNDLKGTFAEGEYPLFKAVDGSVVVPVTGNGLWGPIWGYVALAPDMNTVKGVVFDHDGETPGLGAEITTEKHQGQYAGKTIYEGAQIVGITLKKGGAKESDAAFAHEVDAITGGTKTSDGVTAMLGSCLNYYKPYFDSVRNAAAGAASVEETAAAGEPAAEEVETGAESNEIND